jgi:SAM-dependent methyltransferase
MKIYQRLSGVYDLGWGDFANRYIGFVERLLEEKRILRAKVLDLACGTGTLAIALAGRGHLVVGIDSSPEMIAMARAKSGGAAGVDFDVQDMREFEAGGGYDLVTCGFDALNYLVKPGQLESVFRRVASALADAGIFVFDSNTKRQYLESMSGRRELELAGRRLSQSWVYDPLRKESTTTFVFNDGGMEVHRQRPYGLTEMRRSLSRAGLLVAGTWSSPEGEPFHPDSPRLYASAEKRK